jgi:hypothetical protein
MKIKVINKIIIFIFFLKLIFILLYLKMEFYPIKDYEEYYLINKNGEIKSKRKNIIMKCKTDRGYLQICLRKDGIKKYYFLHRLLGIQFIPNPNDYPCIDHIDNNSLNNDLNNLRWITQSGNRRNSNYKNKSSKYRGVHWDNNAKKWRATIKIDGKKKHLGCFINEEEASLVYQKEYEKIMNLF